MASLYRNHSKSLTFFAILCIYFPVLVLAQVTIRERVELKRQEADPKPSQANASLAETPQYLIAPRTGTLSIRPYFIRQLASPIPNSTCLKITINDTVSYQMGVLPFLSEIRAYPDGFLNICKDPHQNDFLTVYSSSSPIDSFYSIRVTAGDRIAFLYRTDIDLPLWGISNYLEGMNGLIGLGFGVTSSCYKRQLPPYLFINTYSASFDAWFKPEIMLGQSKYYYVRENTANAWELKDDWNPSQPVPERNTSMQFTLEPISPTDKLAVYWEEKKPMPNGQPLPDGIIRLVGRYLDPEGKIKHKVRLKKLGGRICEYEIEVVKPDKLGDNTIARSRRTYLDVNGNAIDVDSLCIYYGSVYGIPPQFIKGQIQEECAFSRALQKLVPSYRFEPYTTQVRIYNKRSQYQNNPFFLRGLWDTQMGTGKCVPSPQCPPEHKNVSFIPYILYPKTMWDFVYDYSQLAMIDPPRGDITPEQHAIYGKRTADGKMDFGKDTYSEMQGMYDKLYKLYDDQLKGADKVKAADLARELMASTMRDQWNEVGWQNIVAQTRIASSYGLLQMLYTTAIGPRKYPKGPDNRPEDLNDTKTCMDFSMRHLDDKIKEAVRSKLGGKQNDWPGGFEGAFRNYIYPKWNTMKSYPETILSNSLNHLPQP